MSAAVLITLIIVGGIVVVSLAGIGWLWWSTAKGLGSFGGERRKFDDMEREVRRLREDVDDLKRRVQ